MTGRTGGGYKAVPQRPTAPYRLWGGLSYKPVCAFPYSVLQSYNIYIISN